MAYISFQPSDYFNTKLYSGTDSSNAITGVGFQPDWVWIKRRNGVASHALMDAVRGNNKSLRSNTTGAEYTNTYFTSFDSDGFTLTSSESDVNASAGTYVSWNWKANGSGSANTDGSISSTVSANTTAGFSILEYTGTGASATIGHGLGAVPKMIIGKQTSGSANGWGIYHVSVGNDKGLAFDTATPSTNPFFDNTDPTSSVFSIGNTGRLNQSGETYIAYCFAEKKGFSKFGSYVGNGSTDGPMIYTGFKPAFVLTKNTGSVSDWILNDNKRLGYNPNNYRFKANDTVAEQTVTDVDLLSNGFKVRTTSTDHNISGNTIIYMAFAEHPIVSSNDIPSTAR